MHELDDTEMDAADVSLPGMVPDFEAYDDYGTPTTSAALHKVQRPMTALVPRPERVVEDRELAQLIDNLEQCHPHHNCNVTNPNASKATYNAVGIVRKGGDVFALAHPTKKTGFKLTAGKKKIDTQSSYQAHFGKVLGGVHSKHLQPYKPNAMRNRLPTFADGTSEPVRPPSQAGARRYKTRPDSAGIIGGREGGDYAGRFVTVHQRSYTRKGLYKTGFTNQGIVSEATRWHRQRMND